MNARHRLIPTVSFQEDVERLEAHIVQRELHSHTPDERCLFRFRDALERAFGILTFSPHACRRSDADRTLRELIVPFGRGGCVALFAIREGDVLLLAARDQHESDYR